MFSSPSCPPCAAAHANHPFHLAKGKQMNLTKRKLHALMHCNDDGRTVAPV